MKHRNVLGTGLLVFGGCLTNLLVSKFLPWLGHFGILVVTACAFGLTLFILAQRWMGDFNPTLTTAKWIARDPDYPFFASLKRIIGQFVGAFLGIGLIFIGFGLFHLGEKVRLGGIGAPATSADVGSFQIAFWETVFLTIFGYVMVVQVPKIQRASKAALVAGATLAGCIIVCGLINGDAAINGARAFGPLAFSSHWHVEPFLWATFIAAGVVGLIARLVGRPSSTLPPSVTQTEESEVIHPTSVQQSAV